VKDLDDLGIAKNGREEKLRARTIEVHGNGAAKSAEDARMAALYRQHVLNEQAPEPVIKIAGLGGTKKPVADVLHKKAE
jgi:tetraether lipid synthase